MQPNASKGTLGCAAIGAPDETTAPGCGTYDVSILHLYVN